MSEGFDKWYNWLITNNIEGGISTGQGDSGNRWKNPKTGKIEHGETHYGITSRDHGAEFSRNAETGRLDGPTIERAMEIYKRDYWDKNRLDEMPQDLAVSLMDYRVNSRPSSSVGALQRLLGVDDDAIVGKNTIAAIRAHEKVMPGGLSRMLNNQRAGHFQSLFESSTDTSPGSPADSIRGWLDRVNNLDASVEAFRGI